MSNFFTIVVDYQRFQNTFMTSSYRTLISHAKFSQ